MASVRSKAASPLKRLARDLCPPLLWRAMGTVKAQLLSSRPVVTGHPDHQDLDVYWSEEMAALLETWGEGNVWNEIQFLLYDRHGKVLDIACGTGKTMQVLARFPRLEITGFDISDLLIGRARERGISSERLFVADATRLVFPDRSFDYAYSIGSLEHFTEGGLHQAIAECHRVITRGAFHMVPVSRSGKDEGWIKAQQSFFNNSVEWWLDKYRARFPEVLVLDSTWEDTFSVGKWFVCIKDGAQ